MNCANHVLVWGWRGSSLFKSQFCSVNLQRPKRSFVYWQPTVTKLCSCYYSTSGAQNFIIGCCCLNRTFNFPFRGVLEGDQRGDSACTCPPSLFLLHAATSYRGCFIHLVIMFFFLCLGFLSLSNRLFRCPCYAAGDYRLAFSS